MSFWDRLFSGKIVATEIELDADGLSIRAPKDELLVTRPTVEQVQAVLKHHKITEVEDTKGGWIWRRGP